MLKNRTLWIFPLITVLLSILLSIPTFGMLTTIFDSIGVLAEGPGSDDGALRDLFTRIGMLYVSILCLSMLAGIANTVVESGLIHATHQVADHGAADFKTSIGVGLRKLLPIIGNRLVMALPLVVVLGVFACVIGVVAGMANSGENGADAAAGIAGIAVVSLYCCLLPASLIYSLITSGIAIFSHRLMILEDVGPVASISRGWALLKANIGSVLQIVLVAIGIAVLVWIVTLIVSLPFQAISVVDQVRLQQELQSGTPDLRVFTRVIHSSLLGSIFSTLASNLLSTPALLFLTICWSLMYRAVTSHNTQPQAPQPPGEAPVTL
jgi:hypothetical protein